MWFFNSLYRSLFDFRWLKERRNNSGSAWSYFFLFVFLLAGLILIPLFVQLPGDVKELRALADKNLPEFQLQLRGGELAVNNIEQPFILKEKDFVLVVDTATTTDVQLKNWLEGENMSGVLVTKSHFEVYNAVKDSTQIQSWKEMPDFSTTKTELMTFMDKWFKPLAMWLIGVVMFVGLFVGLIITKLITLLFVSVIALVVSGIAKKGWTFKQLFNVGLFALTLPSILLIALGWAGGQVSFLYSAILLAAMLLVMFLQDHKEVIK